MRITSVCFLTIFAVIFATAGQERKPKVETNYSGVPNLTKVSSHALFLLNTQDQFVELGVSAAYRGREITAPADWVALEFYSFTRDAKYSAEESRQLFAVVDGKKIEIGRMSYFKYPSGSGRLSLPPEAKVSGKLTLESMTISVMPEQIKQFADGHQVEFRFKDLTLRLADLHLSILREVLSYILPPDNVVSQIGNTGSNLTSSLPYELKNASLETTLAWLRLNIAKYAVPIIQGKGTRFFFESQACNINYGIEVRSLRGDKKILFGNEYRVDLRDVDPMSVYPFYDSGFMTRIFFKTKRNERKIKLSLSDNPTVQFRSVDSSISFEDRAIGESIVAAFAQAVRQCQPSNTQSQ